jgi:hypothetical protein
MSYGVSLERLGPARGYLRRQDPEGSQASRPARGAAHKVRPGYQSENGKADRSHDSAEGAGAGGSGNPIGVRREGRIR